MTDLEGEVWGDLPKSDASIDNRGWVLYYADAKEGNTSDKCNAVVNKEDAVEDIERFGRDDLIKVAHWYYHNELTQEQIAQKLNCTRQRVNRMVRSLTQLGIVTIQITASVGDHLDLEDQLEHRFSLHRVMIVDVKGLSDQAATLELAKRGARLAESLIGNRQRVGISFGSVLGQLVACMRTQVKSLCRVIQLVGGIDEDQMSRTIRPDLSARLLAKKLSCPATLLTAPGVLGRGRDEVLDHPQIKQTLQEAATCSVALVEIEPVGPGCETQRMGYITAQQAQQSVQSGCVGEIALNCFGAQGQALGLLAPEHFIGVDIPTLRKIPHVVAVASGAKRAESVYGALRTGCIDELIIDSELAQSLKEWS